MSDIIVIIEPPLPAIEVIIEPPLPAIEVEISEVGLTGPAGPAFDISEHVNSEEPHPIYDDGRSFLLLYQNAKV